MLVTGLSILTDVAWWRSFYRNTSQKHNLHMMNEGNKERSDTAVLNTSVNGRSHRNLTLFTWYVVVGGFDPTGKVGVFGYGMGVVIQRRQFSQNLCVSWH